MKIVDFKFAFIYYFSSSFVQAAKTRNTSFGSSTVQNEGKVIFTNQQLDTLNEMFRGLDYNALYNVFAQFKHAYHKFYEFTMTTPNIGVLRSIIDCYKKIKQFHGFFKMHIIVLLTADPIYNKTFKSEISRLDLNLQEIDLDKFEHLYKYWDMQLFSKFREDFEVINEFVHKVKEIIVPSISKDPHSPASQSS